MRAFRQINVTAGWVVFLISSVVYLITIEPTTSFWDCGEFISAAYKLEVGHPPGAPFFMLISRFFSLFASSPEMVARWINVMSGLASALTIMFLYWTITHLGRKIVGKKEEYSVPELISIIGSGVLGALAYAFSDTFWFSAVEAEVYATSSLFTAVVFWAILKWENVADEKYANRWLILIAYLMGLSIGVHLLNLLAIPAIVFVYYFRNYKVSRKGVIYSLGVSVILLAVLLYMIIPGIVRVASIFELITVNGIGLPYNSGVILFVIALVGTIAYLIWYSHKKRKPILNTIVLIFSVIVIGYFSYGIILVRSSADPPMNQNEPKDIFTLLSYLNREQYGQSPLFRGQYYNAPITRSENGRKIYTRIDGKYQVTGNRPEYKYDDRFTTLFPRMWSSQPEHVKAYKEWGRIKGEAISVRNRAGENETLYKPTMGENLRFFFRYQVGFMYMRYFMWNFSGRQNDLQSYGEFFKGNWMTGLNFLDESRLGPQDNLPSFLKDNEARNRYYLLPFLLGVTGLIYQYLRHKKDFWVVMMLFVMTGFAIVVFLNQYPFQPRERDYAYAGSFYAFSIWIGLGAMALIEAARRKISGIVPAAMVLLICLLLVPINMIRENWDDHDRSGRYTARDFAANYLNSCAPNAILFTNGDNDTFPLWYVQEVEGFRTDVRVVNLSYLGAGWYINQMKRKSYDSDPVPFGLTYEQFQTGQRDVVYLINRVQDRVELKEAMEFLRSEDPRTKTISGVKDRIDYIPAKKFKISIDSSRIIETGTLRPEMAGQMIDEISWDINRQNLTKSGMMVLDLLDNNNWERPVYFAVTVATEHYLNLTDYFQLQGLAYRLVPIRYQAAPGLTGSIDSEIMFDNMVNKFVWRGVAEPDVYLDENNLRMLSNFRANFGRLASQLLEEGENEKALAALDRCMEVIPGEKVPYNYFVLPLIEGYYKLGEKEKANEMLIELSDLMEEDLKYFLKIEKGKREKIDYELQVRMHIMQELVRLGNTYSKDELFERQEQKFNDLVLLFKSIT